MILLFLVNKKTRVSHVWRLRSVSFDIFIKYFQLLILAENKHFSIFRVKNAVLRFLNNNNDIKAPLVIRIVLVKGAILMAKKKDDRRRVWTFIVYPESAREDWREVLNDKHLQWVCSPLHDKDTNPDGTTKKAHWHVVLVFDGKKSYNDIVSYTSVLGKVKLSDDGKPIIDKETNKPVRIKGATVPQRVESIRGMMRYLIHKDNPEKYQYNQDDIRTYGGADVQKYFVTSDAARLMILRQITEYIDSEHITSFAKLVRYAMKEENYDWLDVIWNHNTNFIHLMIKSEWQDSKALTANDLEADNSDDTKMTVVKAMLKKGATQKVIADTLGVSTRTVRNYIKRIK